MTLKFQTWSLLLPNRQSRDCIWDYWTLELQLTQPLLPDCFREPDTNPASKQALYEWHEIFKSSNGTNRIQTASQRGRPNAAQRGGPSTGLRARGVASCDGGTMEARGPGQARKKLSSGRPSEVFRQRQGSQPKEPASGIWNSCDILRNSVQQHLLSS